MSTNSESQCYFIQLQIDSFVDGELSSAQREVFMSHVHTCEDCGRELQYAQTVHDAILDLPVINCDENVLEPIHRLVNNGHESAAPARSSSLWTALGDWLGSASMFVRYAMPVVAVAVLAIAIWPAVFGPTQDAPQVASQEVQTVDMQQVTYGPEDIQQALLDLNLAIDYLNEVSQRTEVMIGDRFLVTPLQDSLNASFERAMERNRDALLDDPI